MFKQSVFHHILIAIMSIIESESVVEFKDIPKRKSYRNAVIAVHDIRIQLPVSKGVLITFNVLN